MDKLKPVLVCLLKLLASWNFHALQDICLAALPNRTRLAGGRPKRGYAAAKSWHFVNLEARQFAPQPSDNFNHRDNRLLLDEDTQAVGHDFQGQNAYRRLNSLLGEKLAQSDFNVSEQPFPTLLLAPCYVQFQAANCICAVGITAHLAQ